MQRYKLTLAIVAMFGLLVGLGAAPMVQAQDADAVYNATLAPLNSSVTGSDAEGSAVLTVSGDELTIQITVEGVPQDIEHWQHFHGFVDGGQTSVCPTLSDDANGDAIIDLIETEPLAGTTMVPFNDDPVSLNIPTDTYPVADADGAYTYEQTVSLEALETAFEAQFPGQHLDLDQRVIFIHGVPESTTLPDTVASLGDIPAQVTIPIACGEIVKVENGTPVARPIATPNA